MFFKVIMDGGHMGSGKSCEFVRYFEADDAIDLFNLLKVFPGLKSKDSGSAISLIERISEEAFEHGKLEEKQDPYYSRSSKRSRKVESCIIVPIDLETGHREIRGRTREFSKGGFSARYEGVEIPSGTRCRVTINELGKNNKEAELVWSLAISDNSYLSGFRWR